MSKLLYITDSTGEIMSLATDTPEVRAWLNDCTEIFIEEVPPITITELEELS